MNKANDLRVIEEKAGTVCGISRREAARRLLAGVAVLPWAASAHPIWKHFTDELLMDRAEAIASDAKLHFLSAAQHESLSSLAAAMVPGSNEAKVAGFIDLLLSVEQEKHQKEFVASLTALETEASKRYGKRCTAISAAEKNELLTYVSSLQKTGPNENALREAFENLKEWISGAYYSSEMGMRELGWTPDRVFAEFTRCSHDTAHD